MLNKDGYTVREKGKNPFFKRGSYRITYSNNFSVTYHDVKKKKAIEKAIKDGGGLMIKEIKEI